jgi:hypothetical protein
MPSKTWPTSTLLCLLVLSFLGCSAGSEEAGRIRVKPSQLVGLYKLQLSKGWEQLEIKADGIYVQDTISKSQPLHNTGKWHLENNFLDGSDVVLQDAAIVESIGNAGSHTGTVTMHVHDHSGKIALARNEVADWYYERVN